MCVTVPETDQEGLPARVSRNAPGGGGPSAGDPRPTPRSTDITPDPRSTTLRRTSIANTNTRTKKNTVIMPSIVEEQGNADHETLLT